MPTHELDQTLLRTLADAAPASIHEQAQAGFQLLATHIRSRARPPASNRRHESKWWWWTGLGLFSTAAVVALVLGFFNSPVRAEVEFAAILATSEKTLFYLSDKSAGLSSGWVALRQEFAGYTISNYDPKTDQLTLTKDGVKREIRLKDGKVQEGRVESIDITGSVTLDAGEKLEVERATLIFDQENIFPLKNGVVVHITPRRRPDGNIRYDMLYERPTVAGKLERLSAPSIIAIPDSPFSIKVSSPEKPGDDFGFSFKPKK